MSDKFSQIEVSEIENFLEQIFANQRYEKNFAKFIVVIHGLKTNFAEFIFAFLLFTFTLGDLYGHFSTKYIMQLLSKHKFYFTLF